MGFFGLALGFENGSRSIDLGDFLFCTADTLLFTDFTLHASIGNVDLGLIERALVCLAAEV